MAGNNNWNGQEFEIVQYGSHSWRGKVKVWNVASGSHGRKVDGAANGDWKKDDMIMLQTCSKDGKFLIITILENAQRIKSTHRLFIMSSNYFSTESTTETTTTEATSSTDTGIYRFVL